MNLNVMKKVPIALAALAFGTANAAMDMDSRVTQLEHQIEQVRTETAMGTYGALTAPASPAVNGTGWFVNLAVLYEQARFGGSEYAYSDNDRTAGSFPLKGEIKEARPDWEFGVEVGLGLDTGFDNWQAHFQYSHLSNSGSSSLDSGLNGSVVALRGTPSLVTQGATVFTNCTKAKASVDFDFNALELTAGRSYYLSKMISFAPYAGVQTAWIDLKEKVQYTGGTILDVNTIHVHDESDFWGVGPKMGMDGKMHLGAGFSIYTELSGSMLYGNFDVSHNEKYSADEVNHNVKLSADIHRFVPVVRMGIGLMFDKYLDDNKHHIGVSLGYDTRYIWRVNQMIKMDDDATYRYERYSEDATLQGAKLEVRWDF